MQQQLSNSSNRFLKERGTGEAIILAGGLGTRLQSAVPHLPKCMAQVAGRPFLYYVINYLRMQGIEKIIFSLGYKHEIILNWLKEEYPTLNYDYIIEPEPLGTGGAIQFAMQKATAENIFVVNGDTFFKFNAAALLQQHITFKSACTLSLKPMSDFSRYGVVEINQQHIVLSFKEKQFYEKGLINAGVYLINRQQFLDKELPQKCSFEKDYLEKFVNEGCFSGFVDDTYFIDIGIPEDYNRAQNELSKSSLSLSEINQEWTLFLDRDGVINEDKPGGYITTKDELVFTEGLPDVFKKLSDKFKRIIVVTNQRGVGRGIIRYEDLLAMNQKMIKGVENADGGIDQVYFCTDIDDFSFYRKPNPGMALGAVSDFPDIDFNKSIMIGNSLSDMKFGRYAGMYTAFVRSTNKSVSLPHPDIDLMFESLNNFAELL